MPGIILPQTPALSAGGFSASVMAGLSSGQQGAIAQAIAESENMMKAEGTMYPPVTAHTGGSGGYPQFSPLETQSIQGTLDDTTFKMKHLMLWRMIEKVLVSKSTTHEAVRITSKGAEALDPAFAEGGLGAFSVAEFEKIIVQMKLFGEPIEVTDTAAVLSGGLDGSATMLETRTRLGLTQLLGRMERWLIEGDDSVSALQTRGFRASITQGAPDNVFDLEGDLPSGQYLEDIVGYLQEEPNLANDLIAFTAPRTHRALTAADVVAGRYPKDRGGSGVKNYIGGPGEVFLTGEYGDVPILRMPLIHFHPNSLNTVAVGSGAPAAPVTVLTSANVTSGSRFRAKDIGLYDYRFVFVGDKGACAAISVNNVNVDAAGKAPLFTFTDNGITDTVNTSGMGRYYRVYRTEANGSEFDYIGQFARTAAGAGNTTWTDKNWRRPFKRPIFIGELTPDVVYWCQLMDIVRRPLAQVSTTIPFLLYFMGALFMKQPKKWAVIENAAIKA